MSTESAPRSATPATAARGRAKPGGTAAPDTQVAPVTLVAGSGELLVGALPVEADRIVSRRILKAPGARIVRLAIDKGQVMREHTAAVPVLITVLAGRVFVDADGQTAQMPAGAILYLAAHLPHSLEAVEAAQLTLTFLDGYDAITLGTGAPGKTSGNTSAKKTAKPAATKPTVASTLVLASSGADAAALEAITHWHAEISGALATHSTHLLEAASSDDGSRLRHARDRLSQWSSTVLAPQLSAEAGVLYPAAEDSAAGAELVDTLRAELETIGELLQQVVTQHDATELAASSVSLRVTVARHLRAETEQLLPLLAASPQHSLAALWATVEKTVEQTGGPSSGNSGSFSQTADPDAATFVPANLAASESAPSAASESAPSAAAVCECGVLDEPVFPELDVREVPHAIRHATVFGALDSLSAGAGLVLIAPHDPLPLLAQIEQRAPSRFDVSYLQRGPENWRLQLVRTPAEATVS